MKDECEKIRKSCNVKDGDEEEEEHQISLRNIYKDKQSDRLLHKHVLLPMRNSESSLLTPFFLPFISHQVMVTWLRRQASGVSSPLDTPLWEFPLLFSASPTSVTSWPPASGCCTAKSAAESAVRCSNHAGAL